MKYLQAYLILQCDTAKYEDNDNDDDDMLQTVMIYRQVTRDQSTHRDLV